MGQLVSRPFNSAILACWGVHRPAESSGGGDELNAGKGLVPELLGAGAFRTTRRRPQSRRAAARRASENGVACWGGQLGVVLLKVSNLPRASAASASGTGWWLPG